MTAFRRPWADRWGDASVTRPRYVSAYDWPAFLQCTGQFIHEHAREAERHGWQPAHLLGPRGLGVSWLNVGDGRWYCPHRIGWGRHTMLYVMDRTPIVRRAWPDGSTTLVTGRAYTAECGRHLALLEALVS